jgi:predicted metalloprotease with PDZ domain
VILAAIFFAADRPPPPKHTGADFDGMPETHLSGTRDGNGWICGGRIYRGLGIKMAPWNGMVQEIGIDTPASRAGLEEGDLILNRDILEVDRYAAGTELVLDVLRGKDRLRLTIVVERICQE